MSSSSLFADSWPASNWGIPLVFGNSQSLIGRASCLGGSCELQRGFLESRSLIRRAACRVPWHQMKITALHAAHGTTDQLPRKWNERQGSAALPEARGATDQAYAI